MHRGGCLSPCLLRFICQDSGCRGGSGLHACIIILEDRLSDKASAAGARIPEVVFALIPLKGYGRRGCAHRGASCTRARRCAGAGGRWPPPRTRSSRC